MFVEFIFNLLLKNFTKSVIVAAAFFFVASNLFAQSGKVIVSGFVNDSTSGEALVGTNLLVYKDSIDTNHPPFSGASTNNYGFYAIPALSRGSYIIVVRNIGYKTHIEKLKIAITQGRVQLNFTMIPENINLHEVVVEGKKKEEVISSSIDINPDILKRLPSLSGEMDLFKILQTLPGIKVANDISSGLYVRGGSPDENLTLVDGVIVYNPTHLGNFSSTFNSDAIQSIRLIKGAFPAEYGGRLSSVLDIKLRSGTKEKETGKISLGMLTSSFMIEGPLSNKTTYMFSARKMYYDFIQNNFLKSDVVPRYNFYDLNTKITISASESNIFTISGLYSKDKIYNPANSNGIDYDIEWKNSMADLKWLNVNSNSLFIVSSLSYIDYESSSILQDNTSKSTANNYYSVSKLRDIYAKTSAEIFWTKNNMLKIGSEFAFHDYSLIFSNFYDPLIEPTLNASPDLFAIEASLYVQNEVNVFSWLKTNLGARGYYFGAQKHFQVEPRFSAQFILGDNFSLNAAYAVAHQFLHLIVRNDISLPTDLWYPSSEDVEPSKSTQYVLGVDYNLLNKQYVFSIDSYYKRMDNLYEFKNAANYILGDPIPELFTKGEGEAYGIEVFINKSYGNFFGWIGYTLSWTRRKFADLNLGKIFYPRYDRRHDVSIVAAYKFNSSWSVGMNWTFATGQGFTVADGQYQFTTVGVNEDLRLQYNYSARNGYRLPNYHKLDINVNYKFKFNNLDVDAYLNLYNVYNRSNPFAIFATHENNADNRNSLGTTQIKQISLFPFIPSLGITVNY